MTRPSWPGLVRKEARALWPIWAGTVAACVAVTVSNQPHFILPGRLAYFAGSVALAALSVGHEYTHGTMPLLLSMPVDRRRLIAAKLLAVVPMLATLALLALTIGPGGLYFERGTIIGALSILAAVTIAPWLTMFCRNPLAGAVFALGIAGGLQLASLGIVLAWYEVVGASPLGLEALHTRVLAASLAVASVIGAVAGWRAFMRLEALEGRDAPLTWPRWLRRRMALDHSEIEAPAQRSRPLWLLVTKELRLQQLSMTVAAIKVLFWAAAWWFVPRHAANDAVLAAVGVIYGGMLAVLIGAVASASERQMGTHAWQQLLPVSAWQQWLVKTGVILSLSLLLSFALPLVLANGSLAVTAVHAGAIVVLTIGSLFVSSLCRTALQAMTLSAPALLVIATLLGWSFSFVEVGPGVVVAIAAALTPLAWWFAFVNHRAAR